MNYVMSDLHGCFDKYSDMIKKIRLKDSDSLFILGDIVDFGPEPFEIIKDALMRCNVFPIIGDHDLKALKMLTRLSDEESKDDPAFRRNFGDWVRNGGGMPTVEAFTALSDEEKDDMLSYLRDEFTLYDEIDIDGMPFILTHAGLGNFRPDKELDEYTTKEMVLCENDYSRDYFKDKILVTGHVPTFEIDEDCRGLIYRSKSQIGMDCGAAFGEALGCLCLDTDEEYYV